MSNRRLTLVLGASLLSACAAAGGDTPKDKPQQEQTKDDGAGETPDGADTSEQPLAEPTVAVAIASVQMIQDCPDPPEPSAAAGAPAQKPSATQPIADEEAPAPGAAAKRRAGGADFVQPCDQSGMQLTLRVDGDAPQAVRIVAIRLLDKNGKPVGELGSRKPSAWVDQSYAPWDETLAPGAELKASYKLSLPDWSAVEQAIAQPSFGYMFKLEVDVEIGGKLTTVQSPAFPREEPHVIVT